VRPIQVVALERVVLADPAFWTSHFELPYAVVPVGLLAIVFGAVTVGNVGIVAVVGTQGDPQSHLAGRVRPLDLSGSAIPASAIQLAVTVCDAVA
jgi:hypothetical protein